MVSTYRIETERLIIRCYEPSDVLPFLDAAIGSAELLHPWMPWAKDEHTLESKVDLIRKWRGNYDKGTDYVLGIFGLDNKTFIGSTGWTIIADGIAEIGYWINSKYEGQGYMTEAVSALVKVGFEIEGFERITIQGMPENIRSMNIPKRLGFIHEGTLKDKLTDADGKIHDEMIWSMSLDGYDKSAIKSFTVKAFDFVGHERAK